MYIHTWVVMSVCDNTYNYKVYITHTYTVSDKFRNEIDIHFTLASLKITKNRYNTILIYI